jgi:hypothetical protein
VGDDGKPWEAFMTNRILVLIRCLMILAVVCLCLSPWDERSRAEQPTSPLAPAKAIDSFRLADPALVMELVAAEPDVVSPVAVAWDEAGRMFVVEMADYPLAPPGGRVKRFEDRDGDGSYESATVFADKLAYPTSVLPWKGGVLVTSAPHIWYLEDTDGDGRADERRTVLTGFGEGNQQLRVNGLLWVSQELTHLTSSLMRR